jgi:amidohydrolase
VTYNDPVLTEKMLPSLNKTAGEGNIILREAVTGAEDFSFFQEKVPGLFIFLGGMPKGKNPIDAPSHHTPDFFIDESSFTLGIKALSNLTLDYLEE